MICWIGPSERLRSYTRFNGDLIKSFYEVSFSLVSSIESRTLIRSWVLNLEMSELNGLGNVSLTPDGYIFIRLLSPSIGKSEFNNMFLVWKNDHVLYLLIVVKFCERKGRIHGIEGQNLRSLLDCRFLVLKFSLQCGVIWLFYNFE